jgi:hypothetical protein
VPSLVWGRDPQEAFEQPYEYQVQEQFEREARQLCSEFYKLLSTDSHVYRSEERSCEKAVWLLVMDALDSLRGCLDALARKEHRVAGKLFRAVSEATDLAAYFHSATPSSKRDLLKWYADEVVPHSRYREYVKATQGEEIARQLSVHYRNLSRFTHRSYRAILDGYLRAGEDRLLHDRNSELRGIVRDAATFLVLPQTIASYYAVLANLTLEYAAQITDLDLVSSENVRDAFAASLESETIERRFSPRRWLVERLHANESENGDS